MRIALTAVLATAAFATAAQARANLNDVEYLQAARCSGLAAALGNGQGATIDAMLKAESRGRNSYIVDKGAANKADAKRMASRAKDERKAGLQAELSGACARYAG